ncbi:MAG: DUF3604 domain-containing protein, partial [Bradymonadaceae bacterium]
MSDRWALLGVFLLSVVIPSTGTAHSFRPAELEVRASGDGTYRVRWTVPAAPGASRVPADRMDAFQPRFPDTCDRSDHTRRRSRGRTRTATWRLDCPRGALVEGTVGFPAFPTGLSSVLVGFTDAEGNREATVASPHRPEVALPGAQRDDSRAATAGTSPTTTLRTVRRYVRIGVIHILKGTDHLLFILCLLLLLEGLGRIAVTLTAFTAAHSLTLAAATLGWVDVPGRAVETIIALSIVLLAVEVVHRHRGRHTLASRYPWGVAFAFGLLHGLGFAGALASVGLPADALPTALLGFNVGVEIGQLLFVVVALAIWRGVRTVARRLPSFDRALASPLVPVAAAYVVGTLASFWSIRRAAGIFGLVAVLGLTGCVGGEETREPPPDAGSKTDAAAEGSTVDYTEDRPRCAVRDPHRNAYFGDLHVHTALSFDAYNPGNRIDPEGAYRFAKGEPIERPTPGNVENPERIQLDRPLDFAAVTDHAEYLGEVALCRDSGSAVYDTDVCRSLRAKSSESSSGLQGFFTRLADPQPARPDRLCGDERCANASRSVWNRIQRAAERAYDRTESCSFTSFVGYEYTNTRLGNNLHRNVIFRNADVPDEVVSMFEEPKPAGLWRRLRDSCLRADSECDVLTIPHNSNLSSGAMFTRRYPGADSVAEQRQRARLRSRLEPLMEIYQHKGSMECTNGIDGVLGTPDEFCDFEKAYPKDADNCGGEIG